MIWIYNNRRDRWRQFHLSDGLRTPPAYVGIGAYIAFCDRKNWVAWYAEQFPHSRIHPDERNQSEE